MDFSVFLFFLRKVCAKISKNFRKNGIEPSRYASWPAHDWPGRANAKHDRCFVGRKHCQELSGPGRSRQGEFEIK